MTVLLDAHIHLAELDREREVFLARTAGTGRTAFFANSAAPSDWEALRGSARAYGAAVVPFYGVHPWYSGEAGDGWDRTLEEYAADPRCGIGEIGLDTLKGGAPDRQREVFVRQLELACRLGRPFTLHCVRAWGDVLGILHRHAAKLPPFIVHAFGGSPQLMDDLLKAGGYISFCLKDFDRRGEKIAPLVAAVPEQRLLLETDFPHCRRDDTKAPAEAHGECMERLYAAAARMRDVEPAALGRTVYDNGTTVFTDPAAAGRRQAQ